jgi:hypothetical protein
MNAIGAVERRPESPMIKLAAGVAPLVRLRLDDKSHFGNGKSKPRYEHDAASGADASGGITTTRARLTSSQNYLI